MRDDLDFWGHMDPGFEMPLAGKVLAILLIVIGLTASWCDSRAHSQKEMPREDHQAQG